MADRYTSEETVGYGSRVKQSFGGALVGLAMFVAAFPLLFWNEGRAVAEHKALREGAGAVVSVKAAPLDPANEGKLVHVGGTASASGTLVDPTFGVRADGIVLSRNVEMFQWVERKETRTEKQLGGSEKRVTTYEYDTKWDDDAIDSDRFEHRDGHRNPDKFPFEANRVRADPVRLGDFVLSTRYVDDIGNARPLTPTLEQLPPNLAASFQLDDGRLVTSRDPAKPAVGDVRVTFSVVPQQVVSAIGVQRNGRIEAYTASNGREIALLDSGDVPAERMFAQAQSRASMFTWVLRGVGFVLMWFGLSAALGWLSTVLDVLPILGTLVQKGIGIVAALIALPLAMLTIALAWFVYRPLLSVVLVAVAIGAFWLLRRRARGALPPPPPPASPPPLPGV